MKELLSNLSERGVEMWTDGEQLHYRGPRQALTPATLAEIKGKKGALLEALKGGYVARTYPLSHPQRALWYLYQSAPDSPAYNTAMAVRLRFDPDAKALRAALQALSVHHPCLRTSFVAADGAGGLEPFQRVHAYRELVLDEVDASAWSPDELKERVRVAHQRPFDLEKGPVFRASLFHRGVRDHVLLISIHHIVCDGWSMWLLMDELWKAYADRSSVASTELVSVVLPELSPSLSEALREHLVGPKPVASAEDGGAELERFVREGLAGVLEAMGGWRDGECAKEVLRARLSVLPKYTRLFEALLDILEAGKAVSTSNEGLQEHGERLKRAFPELGAFVDLTSACLKALPEVLTGKRNAMEVLFPDGSMELVEKAYRGNAIADFNNERIASFVRAYVEERLRREPDAVIRILEVGAGTGGTSAGVLEALRDVGAQGRVTYQYTDVSPAFARSGERTFGAKAGFVEFKTLDVERSPIDQGFERGSVDVVIGSHVVHATRRIDASLRHLKSLLKKNGLLVLNETTRTQAFLTVTFGLMDGWWLFEDEGARMKGSPLLDREQWRTALEARGLRKVQCVSLDEEGARGGAPQTVIVAESDGILEPQPEGRSTRAAGTYEDFVRWQRALLAGPEGERHWQFWQHQLAGHLPVLDLPLDRPRPAVQTYQGRWVPFQIPETLAVRLRRYARQRGVTLYALLLAGYQSLLHRYSGQEDLIVGCPTAGRQEKASDRVVGHFVNTVPVRADFSGDPSVNEVISRTRVALLGALEHQAYPFAVLVDRLNPRRDAGRPPVFQTMFVFQEPPQELALAEVVTDFYSGSARTSIHGLEFESFPVSQQEGQFDVSAEVTGVGDSLKGVLKYNERLFDASSMERMSRHFTALLERMVDHPELAVSALPLLGEEEARQVLHGWNDTARDWKLECVHTLVEAQARKTPDAPAAVFEGRSVSLGELNRRANQLARFLVARGVAAGEPVGISMERSVEMLVGVLGIFKAGGACVPLDPHYPKDRIAFMLDDAAIRVLVASEGLSGRLPFAPKETVWLERDWPVIEKESGADLEPSSAASGLAYVLYTSGSTGRPKGVAMPHGPLCNLIRWQQENSSVGAGGRTLQFSSLNFDVSFQEILSTLAAGGTLVLLNEALRQDPEGLLRLMKAESVERIFVPFVVLKLLAEAVEGSDALLPSSLREIITAGEQLKMTSAVSAFLKKLEGCRLINQYGPTEAHVVTSLALDGPPERWPYLPPIGRPIANARIYIVDKKLLPVPPGVPGELLIGGKCLADGYYRQPELTSRQFIADPFGGDGGRLYRTGDLARFLSDGSIEFLGRADHQVKIHGFRIEPAEIEKQLLAHPAVVEAVVVCDEDASGLKRLCAYFVRKAEVSPAGLKAHLSEKLPGYMIPSFFVELSAIPLSPNKKVDRRALPPPQVPVLAGSAHVVARDEIEMELVEICRSVLRIERLGVEDNLFDLGVNSLTTLNIQRRIDQAFPGKITVPDLIRFPTIAGLAAAIRGRDAVTPAPSKKAAQYQRFLEALSGSK